MSDNDAIALLRQGKEMLSRNERAKAADMLKRAVEQDSENIEIWEALAQALDDVDEKRIALTTILSIDPTNEYAQQALEETEKSTKGAVDVEIVPGITRKQAQITGVALAVFTLVMCGITFAFTGSQSSQREASRRELTQLAQNATATLDTRNTQAAIFEAEQTEQAIAATQTQLALVSPTPTETPTRSRELPTPIPPTATATEISLRALPPPPSTLRGEIVAWGGTNPASRTFFNLRLYSVAGGGTHTNLNSDLVQAVTVDGSRSQIAYLRLLPNIEQSVIPFLVNGRNPLPENGVNLADVWLSSGAREVAQLSLSRSGRQITFVADSPQIGTSAVYWYDMSTRTTLRLTSDRAEYTWATISPDGTKVIAVKRDANGVDLVLIDAADGVNGYPQSKLTNDGNATIENMPSFSPDGVQVVYSAYTTNPEDADLYLGRLVGNAFVPGGVITVSSPYNELYASFSPDGTALVYASNQAGAYNIFVFDMNTRQTYQLSEEASNIFPAGWTQ